MKKVGLFLLASLLVAGCEGYKTHGKFITEHKDAWMNGYVVGKDGKEIDKDDSADQGLVYCRANQQEDGSAKPVCFRTKFQ